MKTETEKTTEAGNLAPVVEALKTIEKTLRESVKEQTGRELPPVTFVIQRDARAWGHITIAPAWATHEEELDLDYAYAPVAVALGLGHKTVVKGHREVMISGENLAEGALHVFGTLAHEYAHHYNLEAGIRDVDSNGRHNLRFKETAEGLFGLTITEFHKGHWAGWTNTDVGADCAKRWRSSIRLLEEAIDTYAPRHRATGGGFGGGFGGGIVLPPMPTGRDKNGIRATCGCGSIIRTSARALAKGITCGECEEVFKA
jgi:hypothetical protein